MDENEWKQVYPNTRFSSGPVFQSRGEDEQKMIYDQSLHKPIDTSQSREAGARYGAMVYDRSRNLLPEGEYEPVKPAVVEGSPGGMQYDKTREDPNSPDVFEVEFIKPPSDIYPTMPGTSEKVVFSKVGNFFKTEFEGSFDNGDFEETLSHYQEHVLNAGYFKNSDPAIQGEIRTLFAEAKALGSKEGLPAFLNKVETFLASVEPKK